MRFTSRLLATTAAVTAAILGFTATAAFAATIDVGHIDALDVDYESGVLTLNIKTYSPADDDLSPASTTLKVKSSAAITVPSGSAWACLGAAGSTVYVAPQTQNANLLWPGWNTQDVVAAQGPIKLELVSWTGPVGSRFTLYTTSGLPATPNYKINTNTATGCPVSVWPSGIGTNVHGHGNWAFSQLGTYTLTFKATAQNGAGATSGNVTYNFDVS